jgi:hypothetical protein
MPGGIKVSKTPEITNVIKAKDNNMNFFLTSPVDCFAFIANNIC